MSSHDVLLKSYQESIDVGELFADVYQRVVLVELQTIYDNLVGKIVSDKPKFNRFFDLAHLFHRKKNKSLINEKKGLYLWGGVGRGKTHLVDYFYKQLPIEKKLRLHFHRFMQLVHEELNQLPSTPDPLEVVAKKISKKTHLLVLDEMHVNDITDAMLLGRLFKYLFDQDVVLVTTSNMAPSDLYKDGFQRQQFLPAIQLLEQYTKVIEMGGDIDYRSQTIAQIGVYQIGNGALVDKRLEQYFHALSGVELHGDRVDILINQRHIPTKIWADGVVWFSFDELCNTARSVEDYMQIARIFHTVLISDIPVMDSNMDDVARRFNYLIDSFYDLHVNLLVSAEVAPEYLYTGKRLIFEFQRTASRLIEMQSKDYILLKHLN
ncbi:MAG: AFG1 family ATPase [Cocleimonas sp.]|nr:AFG1 family ATPase [Cocleimonas sp.]